MSAVFSSILRAIPPVHREGWPFIAAFAVVTLLLFWLSDILGMIGLGLTLWCVAFFRDPVRRVPIDPTLVLAPADGEVSFVGPVRPPVELGLGDMPMTRISVFMSVFDCHVNRMPVMGTVSRIIYTPGAFVNADLDKASEQNERNALIIETAEHQMFAVVQIAGLVARRIVNFAQQGQGLGAGDRFGLIRFGSRVDVYLPEGFAPTVAEGQRAVAGETPIATTQPVSLTVRAI